jgi:hypothetical protein
MTDEYIPGRWWKVTGPDGRLWCETSNEQEARDSMREGDKLERLFVLHKDEYREVE